MTAWIVAACIAVVAVVISIWLLRPRESKTEEGLFGHDGARFADVGVNAPEYDSVDAVVAALAAGGVRCSNLRTTPTAGQERGECQVHRDDVVIRVFDTNEARNRYLATVKSLIGRANVGGPPGVVGPRWLVVSDTKATANTVKDALGGESI
jgi:hypothetical protein